MRLQNLSFLVFYIQHRHCCRCRLKMRIYCFRKFSCIGQLRQLWIKRKLSGNQKSKLLCSRVYLALSEHRNFLSAVRTLEIAVVLYHTKDRDVHHFSHIVGFLDDHLYQLLR